MESKKLRNDYEAYLQKMQRHFELNSRIKDVQAHSSKVTAKFFFHTLDRIF